MNQLFKCLADPTRRQILILLKDGELTAGSIATHFSTSNATISHHLSILKECKLISSRRSQNNIYYTLKASVFEEIINYLLIFKEGDNNEK